MANASTTVTPMPSSTAVPSTEAAVGMMVAATTESPFLQAFNNTLFFELFLKFGLVFVILGLGALLVLHFGLRWRISRLFSLWARVLPNAAFSIGRWVMSVLFFLLGLLVPFAMLVVWGVKTSVDLPAPGGQLAGIGAVLIFSALIAITYGFMAWRSEEWRMRMSPFIAFALGVGLFVAYEVLVVLLVEPFTYIGFSAVFLTLNVIPVIVLIFDNTGGKEDFGTFVKDTDLGGNAVVAESMFARKRSRTYRVVKNLILVAVATALLALYAYFVYTKLKDSDDPVEADNKWVGLFTVGAVAAVDFVLFLYYFGGYIRHPTSLALFEIVVRGMLIGFGPRYWFAAHSGVYSLLALYLGLSYVDAKVSGGLASASGKSRNDPATIIVENALHLEHVNIDTRFKDFELPSDKSAIISEDGSLDMSDIHELIKQDKSSFITRPLLWVLLTLMYIGEIVVVAVVDNAAIDLTFHIDSSDTASEAGSPIAQWAFGPIAVVFGFVPPLALAALRLFSRNQHRLGWKNVGVGAVAYLLTAGCGVGLFVVTGSELALGAIIFLPLVGVSVGVFLSQWVKNDYYLFSFQESKEKKRRDAAREAREKARQEEAERVKKSTALPTASATGSYSATASASGYTATYSEQEEGTFSDSGSGYSSSGYSGYSDAAPKAKAKGKGKGKGKGKATDKASDGAGGKDALPELAHVVEDHACLGMEDRDWVIVGCLVVGTLATVGFSLLVAITVKAWLGWTLGFSILLLLLTYMPLRKYFNTLQIDLFVIVSGVLAFVLLAAWTVVMWVTQWSLTDEETETEALAVLFVAVMYPSLTAALAGMWKWWDDGWSRSWPVVAMLSFAFVVMVAFGVVVAVVYSPVAGGVVVGMVVLAFYVIFLLAFWVKNDFYLPKPFRYSAGITILFAIAGGVVIGVTQSGFGGFTVSWGCFFLMTAFYAVSFVLTHRNNQPLYGVFIFPVYVYVPANNSVRLDNKGTMAAFFAIFLAILWGLAASIFLRPPWIGLLTAGGFTALLVLLAVTLLRVPSLIFGKRSKYVTEELLEKAKNRVLGVEIGGAHKLEKADPALMHAAPSSQARAARSIKGARQAPLALSAGTTVTEQEEYYSSSSGSGSGSGSYSYSGSGSASADNNNNNNNSSNDGNDGGKAAKEPVTSAADLIKAQKEFAATLDGSNPEGYIKLLEMDVDIREKHREEHRFLAHFQSAVLALADSARKKEIVFVREFLRETERYSLLTNAEARRWEPHDKEWKIFLSLLDHFKVSKRAAYEDDMRKRREAAEAERERQAEIRRREEERRRKEAERLKKKKAKAKAKAKGKSKKAKAKAKSKAKGKAAAATDSGDDPSVSSDPTPPPKPPPPATAGDATEAVGATPEEVKADMSGSQFDDPEFPANETMLYVGEAGIAGEVDGWARPGEYVKGGDPAVFAGEIEPADIQQGALGDCWLLSAMAVLAQRPDLVRNVFLTEAFDENGVYGIQLYNNGRWHRVVIDDQLPVRRGGRGATPVYGSSKTPNELWVSLLEKGFAKFFGSYANLNGGLVHLALVAMSGGNGEAIQLADEKNAQDVLSGAMWSRLVSYRKAGYLMGCGSNTGSDTHTSEAGIVMGHAYSILDVVEADGNKLLKLRNPWGDVEWTGDWADNSDSWTRRLRQKLNVVEDTTDGVFWMSWEDFNTQFRVIYVCRLFDDSWDGHDEVGRFEGETAGGCGNFETCVNNPQYLLTVTKPSQVFIALSRDALDNSLEYLGVNVFSTSGGARVNPRRTRADQRMGMTGWKPMQEVSMEVKLQPGQYALVPSTFDPGQEGEFRLSVHASKKVTLAPLPAA